MCLSVAEGMLRGFEALPGKLARSIFYILKCLAAYSQELWLVEKEQHQTSCPIQSIYVVLCWFVDNHWIEFHKTTYKNDINSQNILNSV